MVSNMPQVTRENLEKATVRHKYSYDNKVVECTYKPGDCAWYLHEFRGLGTSPKLQPLYKICVIIKCINEFNYLIKLEYSEKSRVVHHDKLKPFDGEAVPNWVLNVRNDL